MNKSLFDANTLPVTPAKKVKADKKPAPATKKGEQKKPTPVTKVADKVTPKAAPKTETKAAAKPAAKSEEKKTVAMVRAFAILGSTKDRYSQLTGNRMAFSAYTIAALQVAGMVKITDKGAPIATKGNASLFGAIVSGTAKNHWIKGGRILNGQITADGLNEIQARLSGQTRGYATTLDYVKAFAHAIEKGGTADVNGIKYKVDTQVAAKA